MTKTVLVVDDDPTQRRLIQAVLEREGFAVSHAESGDAAIAHLTSGAPADVILLDLVMPGMDGHETLKEVRARGFQQPVIVLTASGGVDTVVKAMQAGASDFFIKPASPERITVSIRNALSMGDLKGEVERLTKRRHRAGGVQVDHADRAVLGAQAGRAAAGRDAEGDATIARYGEVAARGDRRRGGDRSAGARQADCSGSIDRRDREIVHALDPDVACRGVEAGETESAA